MGTVKARVLATLLLGMAIGAIAAGASFGQSNEGEARIGVLRLPDGGNQVALQLRGSDGGWSDLLVPDLGVQAADAEPGKWLYSSAIAADRRAEPMRLGMLSIRIGAVRGIGAADGARDRARGQARQRRGRGLGATGRARDRGHGT